MKELRAYLRLASGTVLPLLVFLGLALFFSSRPGEAAFFLSAREPEPSAATEAVTALPEPSATAAPPETPVNVLSVSLSGPPESAAEPALPKAAELRVTLLTSVGTLDLGLEEYLLGVVAAEMPASFPPEALKAQAIAARTDTVWRQSGHSPHPNGAVCADPACCKAWLSPVQLAERWGEEYERWSAAIREAVEATAGMVLLYENEPIFAAFHACSAGSTEASENVWQEALPYLRSVSSPETADTVPDFYSTVEVSYEELRRITQEALPAADLSGPGEGWLRDPVYTESERLLTVELGGVEVSGTKLRSLLGLRSAAVIWVCLDEGVRFTAAGYGHGVGMSQYGARQMALDGADCQAILAHYYPGTAVGML